jgi:hypothetical protein
MKSLRYEEDTACMAALKGGCFVRKVRRVRCPVTSPRLREMEWRADCGRRTAGTTKSLRYEEDTACMAALKGGPFVRKVRRVRCSVTSPRLREVEWRADCGRRTAGTTKSLRYEEEGRSATKRKGDLLRRGRAFSCEEERRSPDGEKVSAHTSFSPAPRSREAMGRLAFHPRPAGTTKSFRYEEEVVPATKMKSFRYAEGRGCATRWRGGGRGGWDRGGHRCRLRGGGTRRHRAVRWPGARARRSRCPSTRGRRGRVLRG